MHNFVGVNNEFSERLSPQQSSLGEDVSSSFDNVDGIVEILSAKTKS
jgi:hypothetical protein